MRLVMDLSDADDAMLRALGGLDRAIQDNREAHKREDQARGVIQRRSQGYVMEVIRHHDGEMTNQELMTVLTERLGTRGANIVALATYQLLKDGVLGGKKEQRLNKAGKLQVQRVWFVPVGENAE